MTGENWRVRLSAAAVADFHAILDWTAERFGAAQARAYQQTLIDALDALRGGPKAIGARPRNDVGRDLYTLHVARNHRRGRHFILFRPMSSEAGGIVEVVRLLHDSMDLARHLPPDDE